MKRKTLLTIILAAAAMGLMVFYTWCDTSCAYLQGDIFGIDLKYIGIFFMLAVTALAMGRQPDLVRLLLAGALGGEVVLLAFQVREDVFCPFCLAFGLIILLLCVLHYERPQTGKGLGLKMLYAVGEAQLPFTNIRIPLLGIMLIGCLFMSVAFSGSTIPTFGE
jgi:uncharacterized membrane protein